MGLSWVLLSQRFPWRPCVVTECQKLLLQSFLRNAKLYRSHSLWVLLVTHWLLWDDVWVSCSNPAHPTLISLLPSQTPACLLLFLLTVSLVVRLPGHASLISCFPNVSCEIYIPIADTLAQIWSIPWGSPDSSPSYILMIMLLSSKCLNHLPQFSKQISNFSV